MRAVHVVGSVAESTGGVSSSVIGMCEALVSAGVEVDLVALAPPPRIQPAFLRTFPAGVGPRKLGSSAALNRWLLTMTQDTRVFHGHGLWRMSNVYVARAAQTRSACLVVSPHGMLSPWGLARSRLQKRLFWLLLQRSALRGAACFHATTEQEGEDIRRAGFLQPVCVIPHGIQVKPVSVVAGPRRVLLHLGRMHPGKGIETLLRAWGAVEAEFPDWDLEIVGPRNDQEIADMRALACRMGVTRLEIKGFAFGSDKYSAYARAELFVFPSERENFGMAVAEALASGLPAIVSTGAPWQGIEAHQAGWWVDVNVDSLVAALRNALSRSSEDLRAMGSRGREWMRSDFSWTQIGRRWAETYEWLLDRSRPAPEWVRLD